MGTRFTLAGKKILCGNINVQLTGIQPFTVRPFATVGNDWAYPHKILNSAQKKSYEKIAKAVGEKLAKNGWKGLFGIDVIFEKSTGKLFLIEINARQPASTSFESKLQQSVILSKAKNPSNLLTTFQAHLLALTGTKVSGKLITIKDGAQITQKFLNKKINTKKLNREVARLRKDGFGVFLYDNDEVEADFIRMQSNKGILESENVLNHIGKKLILDI